MLRGLEFQKLGITNQREEQQSPCWQYPAGAKLGIIILSAAVSPTIIVVAGETLTMKQEAMKWGQTM